MMNILSVKKMGAEYQAYIPNISMGSMRDDGVLCEYRIIILEYWVELIYLI